ncbi:MAG: hypothetical protein IKW46_09240 [Bacteroidaceae bacterium]|nr:hypothetical protein [Bacteroidaceae bacterium]
MKRYIKPTSEIIDIETSLMLAQSMYVGENGETVDPDDENFEQLSNGHRGDWENIWGNM